MAGILWRLVRIGLISRAMLYRADIDPIAIGVGTDPFDENYRLLEIYRDHEQVAVANARALSPNGSINSH
jgi:hypothetical protein